MHAFLQTPFWFQIISNVCSLNGEICPAAAAGSERKIVKVWFVSGGRDGGGNRRTDFWDTSSVVPGAAAHGHSEKIGK